MSGMANLKPAAAKQSSEKQQWVLTLSCPDTPGVVHGVANYLLMTGCTILDSQQYGDPDTGLFFMRVSFSRVHDEVTLEQLNSTFGAVGATFRMTWQFYDAEELMPV